MWTLFGQPSAPTSSNKRFTRYPSTSSPGAPNGIGIRRQVPRNPHDPTKKTKSPQCWGYAEIADALIFGCISAPLGADSVRAAAQSVREGAL